MNEDTYSRTYENGPSTPTRADWNRNGDVCGPFRNVWAVNCHLWQWQKKGHLKLLLNPPVGKDVEVDHCAHQEDVMLKTND